MTGGWLDGTVAMITGGGSGIGGAVAQRFVAEGASVAILDRQADRTNEIIDHSIDPSRMLAITGDVRSVEDLHSAVDATIDRFGRLDTLVANAGIWDYQRQLTRLSGTQLSNAFDEIFAVNVKGYLLAAEAAWPELAKTEGSIVMTLSNASFYTNGGGPLYTASKHACLGLMRELAYELAPKIRVNGVACGGMRTDLRGPESLAMSERSIAASFDKRSPDGAPPMIPLHRSSFDPVDFTASYVLLASRQARNITGHAIQVDGGIGVRGFATPSGGDHL
jgi:2,3-dihydroxy-2,3-dihydrophenylpropionate dehydrogenase